MMGFRLDQKQAYLAELKTILEEIKVMNYVDENETVEDEEIEKKVVIKSVSISLDDHKFYSHSSSKEDNDVKALSLG